MTPIRINLLPHRQMRRARAQKVFATLAAIFAGLGLLVVAAGQYWISTSQDRQEARNSFLRAEIAKLDKQIAEISQLKEKTQDLLARKEVIESLQINRAETVRLFEELAGTVPDGLYLRGLKQTGDRFTLNGYAQSSARVSTFMRALDASTLFQEPTLVEVKAAQVGGKRLNEFSLIVIIERPKETAKVQGKGTKR